MVTDKQYWRLMKLLKTGRTLPRAAALADMDEKTARRYRHLGKPPSQSKAARQYRTRVDAFADVWSKLEPFLESEPELEATTLLDYLCERYPERFSEHQLRTLQRRVKAWRAVHGFPKEVFFEQEHLPAHQAQSDFTSFNDLHVTIQRQPFEHLFYHFCLTYSNWETGMVCFSESFEALAEGFQKALWELGGVPEEHRTDNLTAAVIRVGRRDELTDSYKALLAHYTLRASHTNAYSPHENGDIEQAHHRFKRAVLQALILRSSRDFSSRDEYERFLQTIIEKRNLRRSGRLADELRLMRPLPNTKFADFTSLRCRVSRHSTIWVRNNQYSVPSQLIGEWVSVRLYSEHLEVWYSEKLIERIERIRGHRTSAINYRHIVHSLVSKPGAFARFRHRQQLFPRFIFRVCYDRLREVDATAADKQYLQILQMAALMGEELVAAILRELFEKGAIVSADSVFASLRQGQAAALAPEELVSPVEIELTVYDTLLCGSVEEARQ